MNNLAKAAFFLVGIVFAFMIPSLGNLHMFRAGGGFQFISNFQALSLIALLVQIGCAIFLAIRICAMKNESLPDKASIDRAFASLFCCLTVLPAYFIFIDSGWRLDSNLLQAGYLLMIYTTFSSLRFCNE